MLSINVFDWHSRQCRQLLGNGYFLTVCVPHRSQGWRKLWPNEILPIWRFLTLACLKQLIPRNSSFPYPIHPHTQTNSVLNWRRNFILPYLNTFLLRKRKQQGARFWIYEDFELYWSRDILILYFTLWTLTDINYSLWGGDAGGTDLTVRIVQFIKDQNLWHTHLNCPYQQHLVCSQQILVLK